MVKELSKSNTSQNRLIFLIFLEQVLALISSKYFQAVFADTYFNFKDDMVPHIIMNFVKLAPAVRTRLTDIKLIEKLDKTLNNLTIIKQY